MSTTPPTDTFAVSAHVDDVSAGRTAPRPAAGSGTEQQLWAALHARPGTSAELALAAGIGRSTAAKILSRWAANGTATKTATKATMGRGRPSERWWLTDPLLSDPAHPTDDTDPTAAAGAADLTATPTADTSSDTTADTPDAARDDRRDDNDDLHVAAPRQPAHVADTASIPTSPDLATPGGATLDGDSAGSRAAGSSVDAPPAADVTADQPAPRHRGLQPAARLKPGSLRGMVEDFLREHADQSHGPSQIGRALARSSGAVANALVTLDAAGTVVCTQDRPLRYALAPDVADHPAPTA